MYDDSMNGRFAIFAVATPELWMVGFILDLGQIERHGKRCNNCFSQLQGVDNKACR